MKLNKKQFILCVFISFNSFVSSHTYKDYKSKIDRLENSIIQDFSIEVPHGEKINTENQMKFATQMEVKYGIQQKLFAKIDYELSVLESEVLQSLQRGELTKEESEKLKNSVNYAQRIILKSRVNEINLTYQEFRKMLTHTPELQDIYESFSVGKINNCSLHNLTMNSKGDSLSFDIQHTNKFGGEEVSSFTITQNDLTSGYLTSRLDAYNRYNPYHSIITRYSNYLPQGVGTQSFTYKQDENGKITEANFLQEKDEPLFSVFGMSFGKQSIRKYFDCKKAKAFFGPSPASKE